MTHDVWCVGWDDDLCLVFWLRKEKSGNVNNLCAWSQCQRVLCVEIFIHLPNVEVREDCEIRVSAEQLSGVSALIYVM